MQHHGRDLHYIALLDEWNIVVSKRYDEVTELFDYPMYLVVLLPMKIIQKDIYELY
jgi:hypothetical protein